MAKKTAVDTGCAVYYLRRTLDDLLCWATSPKRDAQHELTESWANSYHETIDQQARSVLSSLRDDEPLAAKVRSAKSLAFRLIVLLRDNDDLASVRPHTWALEADRWLFDELAALATEFRSWESAATDKRPAQAADSCEQLPLIDPGLAIARRLLRHSPDYRVELSSNDLRTLVAWLSQHPEKPLSGTSAIMQVFMDKVNGRGAEVGGDAIAFFRLVVAFNRTQTPASDEPKKPVAPGASNAPEGEDTPLVDTANDPPKDSRVGHPQQPKRLKAAEKAWKAHEYACKELGRTPQEVEDSETFEWFRKNRLPQGDDAIYGLDGYEIPDTLKRWRDCLSEYRSANNEKKYGTRIGGVETGSIKRQTRL